MRGQPPSAHDFIAAVVDPDSFESWDGPVDISELPGDYRHALTGAFIRSQADESIVTGRASFGGHPVVLLVGEFTFLGGSVGFAAADRIEAAIARATREGLPVIAAPASGGTRMQEGTPAFVRMAQVTRAVMAHRAAGLPYLVYLRHPTTGGVLASWGSLGQITLAQPGALVAFLGPKVIRALQGQELPEGVQSAENLVDHGVIDAVVPINELGTLLGRVCDILASRSREPMLTRRTRPEGRRAPSPWDSVLHSRTVTRPGYRELLGDALELPMVLGGTGEGERAGPIRAGFARLDGQSVMVVAQDRDSEQDGEPLGAGALRTARRAIRLAGELGLPIVTIIDTAGAELSAHAEENAIAGEIARCAAELSTSTVPSVSVLLGQGTGGGAFALLPAKRVIAAENAWLAPLAPEGAAEILYGDASQASRVAGEQTIRAVDLLDAGIVDAIVPELAADYERSSTAGSEFARAVLAEIIEQLRQQTGSIGAPPGPS